MTLGWNVLLLKRKEFSAFKKMKILYLQRLLNKVQSVSGEAHGSLYKFPYCVSVSTIDSLCNEAFYDE